MNTVNVLVAVLAILIGIAAYQGVQNWKKQMRDEIKHLELRIDNLMEVVRQLSKEQKK